MNKQTTPKILLLSFAILVIFTSIFSLGFLVISKQSQPKTAVLSSSLKTDQKGQQIVEISAKNGFTPKITEAKADTATVLKVSTENTFDCSSAVVINELGINKILPSTGVTDIELGAQPSGKIITAFCNSGINSFQIKFK